MQQLRIGEKTYKSNLGQIKEIELYERAEQLGGKVSEEGVILKFFNRYFGKKSEGVENIESCEPPFVVRIVL